MKLLQSIKMAFSSIFSSKARSFLTALGIIIGVLAVTMLISVAEGATSSVTDQISGMGTNMISAAITGSRETYVTLDELNELAEEDSIAGISPTNSGSMTAKNGTENMTVNVEGVTPAYKDIRNVTLEDGGFILDTDIDNRTAVAVIGVDVADELFGTRDVLGQSVVLDGRAYKIVGILEEQGSTLSGSSDEAVYIPFTTAQRIMRNNKITTFYASAATTDDIEIAKHKLQQFLYRKTGDEDAYNVFTQTELLETVSEVTSTMTYMLGGIAGISLLVGGIGIMNIMLVSVTERTREIGIRKAIGAQRSDIMVQFLLEALVLSLTGGLIGLGLGALGLQGLGQIMSMNLHLSLSVTTLALGFSAAIGIIFGVYPAAKASKLRPIEALRYE